jgi:ribonucleoside-triphosphate reductase
MAEDKLQAHLKPFLIYLNQLSSNASGPSLSIGLDLTVPHDLQSTDAVQPEGKIADTYGSVTDEAKRIANSLMNLLAEDENHKPILSPRLIINITRDSLNDRDAQDLLIQAHKLAASTGAPLFTNLAPIWQRNALYNSGGMRFATDWKDDWELDTLRTGASGTVGINLPRMAYEAKGNESKIFNILDEHLSMATEALKIKAASMDNLFSSGLLPFISGNISGESYLRLKNTSFLIGLVGLNEATKACTGKQIHEGNEATAFASKIVSHLSVETKKLSLSTGLRIALTHGALDDASQRLAELDVERYGWGIVNTQGTRDAPYYTDLTISPLEAEMTLHDRLHIEGNFQPLIKGGHLLPIELNEPQQDADALLKTTKEIVQTENIGAYAFTRTYGYCLNCKTTQGGHHQKCPNCGAAEAYTTFSRLASSYSSLNYWPKPKAFTLDARQRYRLDSKA